MSCVLASVGRTHLRGLVIRHRKVMEQGPLATNEPIAPLTRTLGKVEANGCAMLACGVEAATSIHPPRKWWWHDTTVGAPNAEAHAPNRAGEEAFRFVRSTRWRAAPAREARKGLSPVSARRRARRQVTAATGRCMEPTRRCLVNESGASEVGSSSGKGSSSREKTRGAGGRHRSRTIQRRPLHSDVVHGERGASERVDRSGCSRKQRSLLTPGHANGRGWSDGGNHTSEKMPGSVANAARGIVNGQAPSGNV